MRSNRLMALIEANRGRPRRFEAKQSDQSATLYLYDIIDPYFGVSAADFVKALNLITAPQIDLHINSPGGDVFDGRAIATAIAQHPSNITAYVDGLAASAASYVATAAKQVIMAPGSFMMIHNAWAIAAGDASEIRALAAILDKVDASLVEDYVRVSGASADQVKAWMDAETWFTAQEAVDAGFANSVGDPIDENASSPANAWDLSAYKRPPPAPGDTAAAEQSDPDAEHQARLNRLRATTMRWQ